MFTPLLLLETSPLTAHFHHFFESVESSRINSFITFASLDALIDVYLKLVDTSEKIKHKASRLAKVMKELATPREVI